MGGDASKSGNLFVRTEKAYYFSGEMVTGTVNLQILESGFPGNQIFLKIKGQEVCKWEENITISEPDGQGGTRTRTEIEYHHGKNSFFSNKIFIYGFQGQYLMAGQYQFPFQFQLQPNLPGSYWEQGHNWKASIIYKIKGEIDSFNSSSKKIKHNQEMIIREPMDSAMATQYGEMTVHAKTWCCIDQGTSHIKCVFDRNHYLPGDKAFLWIDVDNSNCNLNIQEIRGTLQQNLILKSNLGRQKIISLNLVNEREVGIPAGSTAKDDNRKTMQIFLMSQINDGNGQVVRPTTNGNLVKCTYTLTATAHLEGCTCCTADPHVTVPIKIVAPVPVTYEQVPQIANWNPQTFQPVLVQFSESNAYSKGQVQNANVNVNMNMMNQNQMM